MSETTPPAPPAARPNAPGRVLIVDDDALLLKALGRAVASAGHEVILCGDPLEAVQRLAGVEVVLSDLMMPGLDGLELLRHVKARAPLAEVILMTGFGTVKSAIAAVRAGAYDYLTKPFEELDIVHMAIARALEKGRLSKRAHELEGLIDAEGRFEGMVGGSQQMQDVFRLVESLAATQSTVLILGETGTGKELVAKAIHLRSPRRSKPFLAVNCSALAETLIDSELFGHAKGAFTGASTSRRGLFELADGGTLFLDEIGDVPASTQVRLLRVLQEGEVRPVGGDKAVQVDVRVVAATHQKLKDSKFRDEKNFRQDLFYRLNVLSIDLPPLRERLEDVPHLARAFLARACKRLEKEPPTLSGEALGLLIRHTWPGNVRELQNAMERAAALARDEVRPEDLPSELSIGEPAPSGFAPPGTLPEAALLALPFAEAKRSAVAAFERSYLSAFLAREGSVSAAARAAGMDRSNFRRLLKSAGLRGDDES